MSGTSEIENTVGGTTKRATTARKPKRRLFELYVDGPRNDISNSYRGQKWVARVRAVSLKQAYKLLGLQQRADTTADLGVVRLHTNNPSGEWPWAMPRNFFVDHKDDEQGGAQ